VTLLWDMTSAELLKLRKRRGIFWWSVVLNLGAALVIEAIIEILHLVNSAHHGPAGGTDNFSGTIQALGALGALIAVLIGTTAGAGDVSAGVFRDLVSTGRSRALLFAVRVPGAALLLVPLLLPGYILAVVVCYALAGDQPTPSAGLAAHFGIWLVTGRLFDLFLAVGFAAVIGSRGIAIGVLLGWQIAIAPLLASIDALGIVREVLSAAASDRLRPVVAGDQHLTPMSLGAALLVLLVWTTAFLAAGTWRTVHQDA
jgi:ABC-type transport system involved in multi-copper enzyme maturation permease subunit